MISRCGLAALIYAAAVLQTSAVLTPEQGISVCWLCLAALLCVWTMAAAEAAAWGGLIGLVGDAISGSPMGVQLVGMSTLCFLLALLRAKWDCRSLAALTLIAIVQTAGLLGCAALAARLGESHPVLTDEAYLIVGCSTATGLCAALVVALWRTLRTGFVSLVFAQRT